MKSHSVGPANGDGPFSNRSKAALRAFVVGLLMVVAVSCRGTTELGVVVPEQALDRWESILSTHPLPERVTPVTIDPAAIPGDNGNAPPAALVFEHTLGPRTTREDRASGAAILLSRRYLVPTRPLWDFTRDLPVEEIDPEDLVSLTEAELPTTARSVVGGYPADPGYPFVEELVARLDLGAAGLRPDRGVGEELAVWFEELPQRTDLLTVESPPQITWIAGAGDIMLERGMRELLLAPDGPERVFSDVLPYLKDADFLLGNLEGAVSRRGTPQNKSFTFRFDPAVLGPLAESGFDYVSLVNNHSFDYGLTAFIDSVRHVTDAGILTSGVGNNLEEAQRIAEAVVGPERVRVLSAGAYPVESSGFDGAFVTTATADRPGVLWADPRNRMAQSAMFAAMEAQFGPDTFDIVMIHGGFEWHTEPSRAQVALYRSFVDAGADLVLGHHSHVVQGLEAYNGGLIAYSLGNFVFPGMYLTEYGEESVLLKVGVVDGNIRYVEPIPVRIDHQLLSLDRETALTERMQSATAALNRER